MDGWMDEWNKWYEQLKIRQSLNIIIYIQLHIYIYIHNTLKNEIWTHRYDFSIAEILTTYTFHHLAHPFMVIKWWKIWPRSTLAIKASGSWRLEAAGSEPWEGGNLWKSHLVSKWLVKYCGMSFCIYIKQY